MAREDLWEFLEFIGRVESAGVHPACRGMKPLIVLLLSSSWDVRWKFIGTHILLGGEGQRVEDPA